MVAGGMFAVASIQLAGSIGVEAFDDSIDGSSNYRSNDFIAVRYDGEEDAGRSIDVEGSKQDVITNGDQLAKGASSDRKSTNTAIKNSVPDDVGDSNVGSIFVHPAIPRDVTMTSDGGAEKTASTTALLQSNSLAQFDATRTAINDTVHDVRVNEDAIINGRDIQDTEKDDSGISVGQTTIKHGSIHNDISVTNETATEESITAARALSTVDENCKDNPDFRFITTMNGKRIDYGGCDYVAENKQRRCRKKINGQKVFFHCSATCDMKDCSCTDVEKTFKIKTGGKALKLNCEDIDSHKLCTIPRVMRKCPMKCKLCGNQAGSTSAPASTSVPALSPPRRLHQD